MDEQARQVIAYWSKKNSIGKPLICQPSPTEGESPLSAGKVAYETKEDALRAGRSLRRGDRKRGLPGKPMWAYPCHRGDHWHLTSSNSGRLAMWVILTTDPLGSRDLIEERGLRRRYVMPSIPEHMHLRDGFRWGVLMVEGFERQKHYQRFVQVLTEAGIPPETWVRVPASPTERDR